MKPLVYYCRWQKASLRLRGRDSTAIWGHLVFKSEGEQEKSQEFRYVLESAELTLHREDGGQILKLDEKGVPIGRER